MFMHDLARWIGWKVDQKAQILRRMAISIPAKHLIRGKFKRTRALAGQWGEDTHHLQPPDTTFNSAFWLEAL